MLAIILVVLAFVAIAGVGIYYYMDIKDHKATNSTDFEKVNKNMDEEKNIRIGNIKYVVDQVNTTNEAMDTYYTDKLTALDKADTGFGALIAAENTTGGSVEIKDVTATDSSKIKLMKDVSVVGSMSIKDLQSTTTSSRSFQACGMGTSGKCIQFPNSDGDTYLTALNGTDNSVVSGSLFKANAGLKTDTINNLGSTSNITISTGAGENKIIVSNSISTDGITVTSGEHSIQITPTNVNIKTGADDASLSKLTINGKGLGVVGIGSTATTDEIAGFLKNKRLLTIAS